MWPLITSEQDIRQCIGWDGPQTGKRPGQERKKKLSRIGRIWIQNIPKQMGQNQKSAKRGKFIALSTNI